MMTTILTLAFLFLALLAPVKAAALDDLATLSLKCHGAPNINPDTCAWIVPLPARASIHCDAKAIGTTGSEVAEDALCTACRAYRGTLEKRSEDRAAIPGSGAAKGVTATSVRHLFSDMLCAALQDNQARAVVRFGGSRNAIERRRNAAMRRPAHPENSRQEAAAGSDSQVDRNVQDSGQESAERPCSMTATLWRKVGPGNANTAFESHAGATHFVSIT